MSKLEVDAIEPQSGTTITIGSSGDTVNLVGTLQSNGSPLPGDISSVVAGTGLSGGGTTGAVTLNIEAAQPTITSLGTITGFTSTGIDDNADATAITIDSSEQIGIGTSSMDGKLHVMRSDAGATGKSGSVIVAENQGNCFVSLLGLNSDNCTIFFGDNNNDNAGQLDYDHANDSMSFFTNQSERMRITSAGLVGIGTSAPSEELEVSGGQNTIIKSKTTTSTALGGFEAHGSASSYIKVFQHGPSFGGTTFGGVSGNDQSLIEAQAASSVVFSTQGNAGGSNPDFIFAPQRSQKVIIKSDGKVGIGTSAPAGVVGTDNVLEIAGSSNPGLVINDTGQAEKYAFHALATKLNMYYGTTAFFTFDASNSNTGINNASPSTTLDVNGTIKATAFDGAGKVLQVIQTVKTDAFSTTSTSMTDVTGFSVSITPSSSSNKILVIVNVSMLSNSGANGSLINLLRGSTSLTSSSAGGSADTNNAWNVGGGGGITNNERKYNSPSISFLDSPSSTSSLTYKCQMMVNGGSTTAFFNRWALNTDHAGVSTITAMEIQG